MSTFPVLLPVAATLYVGLAVFALIRSRARVARLFALTMLLATGCC